MALTEKQIEKALRANGGFVTHTAKALNVTTQAIYKRLNKSEHLQQVKHDIDEGYLDLAESKLMEKVNEGDNGSLFFYLKCKGQRRGYIEKQRIDMNADVNGKQNINVNIHEVKTQKKG